MTTHSRGLDRTAISVSMTKEMVAEIDVRAKALGLNRSQYLVLLAKSDLSEGGALMLKEEGTSVKPVAPTVVRGAVAPTDRSVGYISKPESRK